MNKVTRKRDYSITIYGSNFGEKPGIVKIDDILVHRWNILSWDNNTIQIQNYEESKGIHKFQIIANGGRSTIQKEFNIREYADIDDYNTMNQIIEKIKNYFVVIKRGVIQ
ncbi:MAG: hypothetical protein JO297_18450 [Nitrososphaeraceae archaeon]|nr:hypothetical protein [Nitrososphaeraceae archaeon]